MARNLILTYVNAQCTLMSFSRPATRQRRQYSANGRQRRVHCPRHYAHNPIITASEYLCRCSCLRLFLTLFPHFLVLLDIPPSPQEIMCCTKQRFDVYDMAVKHSPTGAPFHPRPGTVFNKHVVGKGSKDSVFQSMNAQSSQVQGLRRATLASNTGTLPM
jgi:hypothetical protein